MSYIQFNLPVSVKSVLLHQISMFTSNQHVVVVINERNVNGKFCMITELNVRDCVIMLANVTRGLAQLSL